MKKLLLVGTVASSLMLASTVMAATASGKVTAVDGNNITVQTEDGQHMTMQTTDKTTYRKKKMAKKHKTKRGKKNIEWTYTPIAEEDDWVDIVYDPTTGQGTAYQIQDVVVYDD